MRTLTVGEFKAQISEVIAAVKAGESVIVCYGRQRQRIAAFVPYAKFAANTDKRPIGLLKGRASFSLAPDFDLTDEAFLAT